MNKRGAVGETALHLCILQDNPVLNEISKVLIRLYPKQALDYYEGEEYYGMSLVMVVLHLIRDATESSTLAERGQNHD